MQNKGGLVDGKLHEECDDMGCGETFEVAGHSRTVELEDDEAVIVPDAFEDRCFVDCFSARPPVYEITGTIRQIASAINALGGGLNFETGAKIKKNGRKVTSPKLLKASKRKKLVGSIEPGSVVINRTNMNNPKVMTFSGTLYSIASQINSYGGNGVELLKSGGEINASAPLEKTSTVLPKEEKPNEKSPDLLLIEENIADLKKVVKLFKGADRTQINQNIKDLQSVKKLFE